MDFIHNVNSISINRSCCSFPALKGRETQSRLLSLIELNKRIPDFCLFYLRFWRGDEIAFLVSEEPLHFNNPSKTPGVTKEYIRVFEVLMSLFIHLWSDPLRKLFISPSLLVEWSTEDVGSSTLLNRN